MFNLAFKKGQAPTKWKTLIIKTMYKRKGNRRQLKNWRGIFLTLSISKIFEKLILNRISQDIENNFSEAAAGGRKGRSTFDHLFVWEAINDYYKYIKCNIMFTFLDLEKAFDKLFLKSCLLDLFKSRINGKCLRSIYELNKKGFIEIETPCGRTEEVEIEENLKQGTILAAPICANHIDKGMQPIVKNELGISFGKMKIPPLLYQDDILLASISSEKMQEMLNIAEEFQNNNLLNFNLEKSKIMHMQFNRKKLDSAKTKFKLNNEVINSVETYKYLGDLKDCKNSLDKSISNRQNSAKAVINQIKFLVNQMPFKEKSLEISIRLIECILIPKILYACETWSKISKSQIKQLENIQKDALTIINCLPFSTPYQGILYECGLKPMKYSIQEKRLTYLHKILNMNDTKLVKQVYKEQKRLNLVDCWHNTITEVLKSLNIHLTEKQISKLQTKEGKG